MAIPVVTVLALLYSMAAGAVIVGVTETAAAARLRSQISGEASRAV